MWYLQAYRTAFIHIPRTGGMALSLAVKPLIGLGDGWDLGHLRHLPYSTMAAMLGRTDWTWIACYRPLTEIRESLLAMVQRDRLRIGNAPFAPEWLDVLQSSDPLGTIWERNEWPEDDEAWKSYWIGDCPAESLVIMNFERLADDWADVSRGMLGQELPLPPERVN
jgi:hypothetical protein